MKYALFGAGTLGERYYNLLKDKYDIACFVDNDIKKHGKEYLSLGVISPASLLESGLAVIIASAHVIDIMLQLFDMGIKVFYLPESAASPNLLHIDFTKHDSIAEKPNKICVIRQNYAGADSSALIKNNPFDDLNIVEVNALSKDSYYYYHYITSVLIVSQFLEPIHGNKKSIELWHGSFLIKAIGYTVKERIDKMGADYVHNAFATKTAICSLSELSNIFFGYCFKIEPSKFRITGYPHNDFLFNNDGINALEKCFGEISQKYIVIYMPTYRERLDSAKNGESTFVFDMPGFDETDFNDFLSQNDILFLHKMHALHIAQATISDTKNVKQLTDAILDEQNIDLYEALSGTDCLVSDYSAVIIDYLLTDKPIILTPTDLESYTESRGLLLEPYDAWMPGEIALDYNQFKRALKNALFGEDSYKTDRLRLKRITHKYTDGKSTERVLKLARELLGQ